MLNAFAPNVVCCPGSSSGGNWDNNPFFAVLEPNRSNGLKKKSAVDCFQIRAISHNRFSDKIGEISVDDIGQIKKAVSLILDIDPDDCI